MGHLGVLWNVVRQFRFGAGDLVGAKEHADPRLLNALAFAERAHRDVRQARKGTLFPYAVHPIRVAEVLYKSRCDQDGRISDRDLDLVIAGFLHDVLEDTKTGAAEVEREFGARVRELVTKASEEAKLDPRDVEVKREERMRQAVEHLRVEPDPDVRALIAADKLDNARSLRLDAERDGEQTWLRFNAPKDKQRSYYRDVVAVLLERDPGSRLVAALADEVELLFPAGEPAS